MNENKLLSVLILSGGFDSRCEQRRKYKQAVNTDPRTRGIG